MREGQATVDGSEGVRAYWSIGWVDGELIWSPKVESKPRWRKHLVPTKSTTIMSIAANQIFAERIRILHF